MEYDMTFLKKATIFKTKTKILVLEFFISIIHNLLWGVPHSVPSKEDN
jgi:hypothetical protein